VSTGDDLPQVRDLDVGVAFGGFERLVAEEFLDVLDVRPTPKKIGRDAMTPMLPTTLCRLPDYAA